MYEDGVCQYALHLHKPNAFFRHSYKVFDSALGSHKLMTGKSRREHTSAHSSTKIAVILAFWSVWSILCSVKPRDFNNARCSAMIRY